MFHYEVTVSSKAVTVHALVGDVLVHLDQPNARYAVETVEPQAHDSFFRWGFFNPNFPLARARRMMGGAFDRQIELRRLIPQPLHPLPVLHGHRQIQYGLSALGSCVGGLGK